jgi:tRNA(Met) cytidine acetyltransferase
MTANPLSELRAVLRQQHHRMLVILSGEAAWQNQQLQHLWHADERLLWLGTPSREQAQALSPATVETIDETRLTHYLGQEADGVVIDVRQGLSANALGIASGLIRGGGLLVLLTPARTDWPGLPNPHHARFLNTPYQVSDALPYFTQHLMAQWQQERQQHRLLWLEQTAPHAETLATLLKTLQMQPHTQTKPLPFAPTDEPTVPTHEQQAALAAIDSVAFGHRKRPLILQADRGRGKSSLLGMAAVACLLKGKQHIVITASRFDQASTAFAQALKRLKPVPQIEQLVTQQGLIQFEFAGQKKQLRFMAPDQLVLEPTEADLLMIDEAAHLPTPLLTQLLERHHRLVFATTVQGYEGSGRGFELRFKQTLNALTPDWKLCQLEKPVRWAEHDPLETSINHALLLDCPASDSASVGMDVSPPTTIERLSTADLSSQRDLLKSAFELLVQAHYQTTPNDLQQLLSAPNLHILIAHQQQRVMGVLLAVEEGRLPPRQTPVHGHLVPQRLQSQYALKHFQTLSSWRVMRIAVNPQQQRQGLGKQLLSALTTLAHEAGIDYLSTSFGASENLLPFWFGQGYRPLHVGVKRDKASGSYNLVAAKPISAPARQALAQIQKSFQAQFPHNLMEALPYLSAPLVLAILQTFRYPQQPDACHQAIQDYAQARRSYESVSGRLWAWSLHNAQAIGQLPYAQQQVWCDKILKKQPWAQVAHDHHLPGRKGVEEQLRLSAQTLWSAIQNEQRGRQRPRPPTERGKERSKEH